MPLPSHPLPATLAASVEQELVIRKSRFIAHVAPVASAKEAEEAISAIRKRRWDARHNCSAQVLGLTGEHARSSDDGEPSGTAGMPMLEVLRRRELTDVVAVVTRYFGGIKLGAGGLVRAYSSAVSGVLDLASLVDRRMLAQLVVTVPHTEAGRIENLLRDWTQRTGAVLGEPQYDADAMFDVWSPLEAAAGLQAEVAAASAGTVTAIATGIERVVGVPR